MEKRRLGRGLDVLLGNGDDGSSGAGGASTVAIERIQQNPFQPRKEFNAEELTALGESIRHHGILQPLVVRVQGDHYELIAGERRLRAAKAAGFTEVPIRVVDFNDQQTLEAALVENIQRTDLNPIEKAQGFKDYLGRFHMTQEQLAQRIGLDRTTISNLVNLLELPSEVQEAVRVGEISLGHAKVLKGLSDPQQQIALCREIIARRYSVRATEDVIKAQNAEKAASRSEKTGPRKTTHVQAIENELQQKLTTRVEIRLREKDKGQIVLRFESNDDFERLLEVLRK